MSSAKPRAFFLQTLHTFSGTKSSYYNISPFTSILVLLMKSGDVRRELQPTQAILSERGTTHQNIRLVVVARVSLVAVEQSYVTLVTSGHTANVLVFP